MARRRSVAEVEGRGRWPGRARVGCLLTAWAALLPAWAAHAVTYAPVEPAALARAADAVVVARVGVADTRLDARGVSRTVVPLWVTDVLAGPLEPGPLLLVQPGAQRGRAGRRLPGSPQFQPGSRALFFLRRAPDGTLHTLHLGLGSFRLRFDPALAEEVAEPELGGSAVVLSPPGPGAAWLRARPLSAWREEVRRARRPGGGGGGLPIRTLPSELLATGTSVTARFTLLGPARWFEPDQGLPVGYRIDSAGDPRFTLAETVAQVEQAMAAWSSVAGAQLELRADGFTGIAPAGACDGESRILYEDPFDEIDDPIGCGGVLALGGFCQTGEQVTVGGVVYNRIVEGDITFADGWDGCPGRDDPCLREEITTHELGHTLGLGHSSERDPEPDPGLAEATMYFRVHDDGRCASLRADDEAAVASVYPGARPPGGSGGPLAGRLLNLRDVPGDPERRRLVVLSRDPAVVAPPAGSAGDPSIAGALLRLANPSTGEEALLPLPAAGWQALGRPAGSRGFRYRDSAGLLGACRKVLVRPGRLWKAVCQGAGIAFDLDEAGGQGLLEVELALGADPPYCLRFGGLVKRDDSTQDGSGRFRAVDAPPPPGCS